MGALPKLAVYHFCFPVPVRALHISLVEAQAVMPDSSSEVVNGAVRIA